MNLQTAKNERVCPREEIVAYVDGEITPREELELEMHIAGCKTCADELNAQKTLLCALDSFRMIEREIELPEDFTKIVVTKAESNVSGLRRPKERRNALVICSVLFLMVLVGLSSGDSETVFGAFPKLIEQFVAVGSFVLHFVYDLAFGITVVLRFLSNQFVFNSDVSTAFLVVSLAISLIILSRLIIRYNRTAQIKIQTQEK